MRNKRDEYRKDVKPGEKRDSTGGKATRSPRPPKHNPVQRSLQN